MTRVLTTTPTVGQTYETVWHVGTAAPGSTDPVIPLPDRSAYITVRKAVTTDVVHPLDGPHQMQRYSYRPAAAGYVGSNHEYRTSPRCPAAAVGLPATEGRGAAVEIQKLEAAFADVELIQARQRTARLLHFGLDQAVPGLPHQRLATELGNLVKQCA